MDNCLIPTFLLVIISMLLIISFVFASVCALIGSNCRLRCTDIMLWRSNSLQANLVHKLYPKFFMFMSANVLIPQISGATALNIRWRILIQVLLEIHDFEYIFVNHIMAFWHGDTLRMHYWDRPNFNIGRTKFPNSNVFRLVLQLSLRNLLKPGVKSGIKM